MPDPFLTAFIFQVYGRLAITPTSRAGLNIHSGVNKKLHIFDFKFSPLKTQKRLVLSRQSYLYKNVQGSVVSNSKWICAQSSTKETSWMPTEREGLHKSCGKLGSHYIELRVYWCVKGVHNTLYGKTKSCNMYNMISTLWIHIPPPSKTATRDSFIYS